jgi:AcrR family transcriptional regulator
MRHRKRKWGGKPMDETSRTDPRTRKTKRAIRNAFAKLLSEKELNDITVRDVAELAEINRKTFYRYYSGIYQVVDEIENEIVRSYEQILGEIDFRRDFENPYRIFERLTDTIQTDLDFYGCLLSMQGNVSLASKLSEMLKAKTMETLLRHVSMDARVADIMLDYVISGMVAVYQKWFNSGRREPIETISETLSALAFSGINGIMAFGKEGF